MRTQKREQILRKKLEDKRRKYLNLIWNVENDYVGSEEL